MERLTHRYTSGMAWASIFNVVARGENECTGPIIDRLASYEDTNLTPKEIMGLCSMDRRAKIADLLRMEENKPLALEQLREMCGEPVWAMLRLPTNGIKGGWALVDTRNGYAAAQQRWTNRTLWYDEYGKTWVAYRRKPEEEK